MNAVEIIDALLSQEKALSELSEELKNALELDELFNSGEKSRLVGLIASSERRLSEVRGAIERRLEALEANNKYW